MTRSNILYTLIKEIFLILDDGDRRLLGKYNLTVARFYALVHLGNCPGLSISELSSLMFCDKSNITRLVRGMEADNLVRRQPHERDGRAIRLYLSDAGERLREEVIAAHSEHNVERFNHALPFIEQDALLSHLQCLRSHLRANLASMEAA